MKIFGKLSVLLCVLISHFQPLLQSCKLLYSNIDEYFYFVSWATDWKKNRLIHSKHCMQVRDANIPYQCLFCLFLFAFNIFLFMNSIWLYLLTYVNSILIPSLFVNVIFVSFINKFYTFSYNYFILYNTTIL